MSNHIFCSRRYGDVYVAASADEVLQLHLNQLNKFGIPQNALPKVEELELEQIPDETFLSIRKRVRGQETGEVETHTCAEWASTKSLGHLTTTTLSEFKASLE